MICAENEMAHPDAIEWAKGPAILSIGSQFKARGLFLSGREKALYERMKGWGQNTNPCIIPMAVAS